ncbi:MAG: hypothetical protein V3V28_05265 [Polaribacter sp.]
MCNLIVKHLKNISELHLLFTEIKKKNYFRKETKENEIMPFCEDRIICLDSKKVIYKTVKGDYYNPFCI